MNLCFQYLASEIFTSLPPAIRTLTYQLYTNTPSLSTLLSPSTNTKSSTTTLLNNLPTSITETLSTYSLLSPEQTPTEFLTPVMNSYISVLTTAPPPPSQTKSDVDGCEVCGRDWIPLTYHHLIPRSVHAKVLKRGWHLESDLNNVACESSHLFLYLFFLSGRFDCEERTNLGGGLNFGNETDILVWICRVM